MKIINKYFEDLVKNINQINSRDIEKITNIFLRAYKNNNQIFFCGNGGSAANSTHLSNDLMLGLNKKKEGLNIISLASNVAKISCIANDLSYEKIFSHQLKLSAKKNDILVCLSGSGNSKNILSALQLAKQIGMKTVSILGFDGGKAKKISDFYIHFEVNDMQVSEDMQMVVFNAVMKNLSKHF